MSSLLRMITFPVRLMSLDVVVIFCSMSLCEWQCVCGAVPLWNYHFHCYSWCFVVFVQPFKLTICSLILWWTFCWHCIISTMSFIHFISFHFTPLSLSFFPFFLLLLLLFAFQFSALDFLCVCVCLYIFWRHTWSGLM